LNNNLYQWHAEQLVRYEMQEVDRAVEQARLLREASLDGRGWLTRAANGLGNLLKARTKALQEQRSIEPNVLPRKYPRSVY
jgi:hypothetical protein